MRKTYKQPEANTVNKFRGKVQEWQWTSSETRQPENNKRKGVENRLEKNSYNPEFYTQKIYLAKLIINLKLFKNKLKFREFFNNRHSTRQKLDLHKIRLLCLVV